MSKVGILDLVRQRVVIGDGAMGTMLYRHGAFLNTCFDELNLTRPELVEIVHAGYVEAGSDFIETNTFGANGFKLSRFGLAEKVEQINTAAVEIARKCAGDDVLVAGSVGPLGIDWPGLSGSFGEQIRVAFTRQISALVSAGADFLILETFSNPQELLAAVTVAGEICDLPIVAQLSVNEHNETIYGNRLEPSIVQIASDRAVDVVGLNCSIGPSAMLESLKLIRNVTDKPISVQPNAGFPRNVDGRSIYMSTPEYMSEYAKRFFENGARIIGGCCGTTPEHIREIVKVVRAINKSETQRKPCVVTVRSVSERAAAVETVSLGEKSRIGAKIAAGEKFCTIEVVPPRGADISQLQEKVRLCAEHGIDAINVPDGPRASSRLSPLITAVKVQDTADIETILHVCCRDRNIIGMQSDMLGCEAMGIKNVLLVTGDPPKLGDYPNATAVFDLDAIALTQVVNNLNRGLDIAGNELSGPLSLTIGVGANPVASDIAREIERFRQKVMAGAEYAITQPVFDTEMLFRFQDAVSDSSIPIVAGIWPFTSYKNAEFMSNEVPGVVVPDSLLERMSRAGTREDGRKIGVEIAIEMIERIAGRVAGFAVSAPFGNVRIALAVLGKIEIDEI